MFGFRDRFRVSGFRVLSLGSKKDLSIATRSLPSEATTMMLSRKIQFCSGAPKTGLTTPYNHVYPQKMGEHSRYLKPQGELEDHWPNQCAPS